MHPILLQAIALVFPHKTCFSEFSSQINPGDRIAIVGPNGAGKSSLLQMLAGNSLPSQGEIRFPPALAIGYVPQLIDNNHPMSGSEHFQHALTQALRQQPDLLLLDEPTNHLDSKKRHSLMKMLNRYQGTLIVISHDLTFINTCCERIWHIESEKIQIFLGNYQDFLNNQAKALNAVEEKRKILRQQQIACHQSLMQAEQRAAQSRQRGEKNIQQRKWPTVTSKTKAARHIKSHVNRQALIANQKQVLAQERAALTIPTLAPHFQLPARQCDKTSLVYIDNGSFGYERQILCERLSLTVNRHDRILIQGDNGCGKTTLLKAIMNDPEVIKTGFWQLPKIDEIGYYDQHYQSLPIESTPLCALQKVCHWPLTKLRQHLADFLFKENEIVYAPMTTLSGGEKARLMLAMIAAKMPSLLLLDEITNNLDLSTKNHLITTLNQYPGTMIIVSHDDHFLNSIKGATYYPMPSSLIK
ncbi:ABC-F family ATP-binding cassette domain-containing protein [Candidatus Berkiella aquae]|uniref:ATP-binding cassette domain-containing protein n=1 Tax=Candidatus Berkiella aquae TaxID=295108 RepID=A0A0Q9YTN3_9GAMM|nr:ATP-binding cassette domain-containing protein [Candidatus Berkiella aquae]MCS5709847.1 ATP-binding cassette domain-containing protein [Candidatus Berkiella aquae]